MRCRLLGVLKQADSCGVVMEYSEARKIAQQEAVDDIVEEERLRVQEESELSLLFMDQQFARRAEEGKVRDEKIRD